MSDGVLVLIAGGSHRPSPGRANSHSLSGYDTTAAVLSSLLFYLVGTPSAYSRLQGEVDKFVPRGETPSLKRFSEMHYLDACMRATFFSTHLIRELLTPSGIQKRGASVISACNEWFPSVKLSPRPSSRQNDWSLVSGHRQHTSV